MRHKIRPRSRMWKGGGSSPKATFRGKETRAPRQVIIQSSSDKSSCSSQLPRPPVRDLQCPKIARQAQRCTVPSNCPGNAAYIHSKPGTSSAGSRQVFNINYHTSKFSHPQAVHRDLHVPGPSSRGQVSRRELTRVLELHSCGVSLISNTISPPEAMSS